MYYLYTANNCNQCAQVIEFIDSCKIDYKKINVDTENIAPPIIIYAFPALFFKDELLAYGEDIIEYIEKKSQPII